MNVGNPVVFEAPGTRLASALVKLADTVALQK
jgi:hypothetical protein